MLHVRKELSLQLARNGEFAHKDCFAALLKNNMLVPSPIRGQHVITRNPGRNPGFPPHAFAGAGSGAGMTKRRNVRCQKSEPITMRCSTKLMILLLRGNPLRRCGFSTALVAACSS